MSRGCITFFEMVKQRFDQTVEQGAAEVRKRWEESDYAADNPLHRLRGQALVWLFSLAKRWRKSDVPFRSSYTPVFLALGGIVLGATLGNLEVMLAGVLISVRTRGLRAGLLTTLICFVAIVLAAHNQVHTPAGRGLLIGLICFLCVSVLACVLIDSLETARQEADSRRNEAETVARRFRFLAEATAMLETEYSYEAVLSSVTRAIVPACAQWATADVFSDGQFRRVALSHQDDAVAALLRAAQRDRALSIPSGHPLYQALLAHQACIFSDVTATLLEPLRLDWQDTAGLKPAHLMFVPLTARNRLLGALTFISVEQDRPFSNGDLATAQDLALRVATAMDNLRLYSKAREEVADLARREREAASQSSQLQQQRMALELLNARLTMAVRTDGLTGLLNHLTFQMELQKEFSQAMEEGKPLSLVLLDIDNFKSYNDTFGHPAGDDLLRRISAVLQNTARGTDLVARYGGEEFVIVMPDTDRAGALEAVERLRSAVETSRGHKRPITASFGVATLTDSVPGARELISLADQALYRSKDEGRNRVTHAEWMSEAVVFDSGAAVRVRS